jgi:hypothetical protein
MQATMREFERYTARWMAAIGYRAFRSSRSRRRVDIVRWQRRYIPHVPTLIVLFGFRAGEALINALDRLPVAIRFECRMSRFRLVGTASVAVASETTQIRRAFMGSMSIILVRYGVVVCTRAADQNRARSPARYAVQVISRQMRCLTPSVVL